jgi:hypothetical protein
MKVVMTWDDGDGYDREGYQIINHPLERAQWADGQEHRLTSDAAAHDIIEHINGWWNIGTVEDELEALGAAWYCRGQWQDGWVAGLRRDIAGNLRYIPHRILDDCPIKVTSIEDLEDLTKIKKLWEACMDDSIDHFGFTGFKNTRKSLDKVQDWMTLGYRKAEKRYGKRQADGGFIMFNCVKRALDQHSPEWPGQRFNLHYSISQYQAWIEE